MRILVCGGRNYGRVVRTMASPDDEPEDAQKRLTEYRHVQDVLHKLVMDHSTERNDFDNWLPTDITIIAGGATGADSAAADFAITQFCRLEEFPAEWEKYGKRAGYIRNKKMLEEGRPDLVVAFPGGPGTAMMVEIAARAGVKVLKP